MVAALDRRGGAWRLVIDRRARAGGFETVTLGDADLATLADRLAKAGVTRLVRVAPACECLAKIDATPDAAGEELVAAMDLLGEAGLPEDVPAHRRAVGFVGSPSRVLVTAWMRREAISPKLTIPGIEEYWITEPAALLSLAKGEGFSLLSWDRDLGSILAVKTAGERPLVRCIRADGNDTAAWSKALAAAAKSVGTESVASADSVRGVMTDTATLGATGISETAAAGEFGIAMGAVLVAAGDDARSALATLRSGSENGREPVMLRAARWISVPKRAVLAGAVSLGLCALAPMGMAWARLKVAESKLASIGGAKDEREALTKDAALYKQLEQSRWPMTKLLADVSNATPVGVVMESLSLERDGSQGVLMKGRADTPEVLSTLQKNLAGSGVVSAVQVTSVEADGNGVSFSLQARVTSPRSASRLTDDYGKSTLQDRIYAGGSSPIAGAVPSEAAKPDAMAMDDKDDPVEKSAGADDGGGDGTGSRTVRLNSGARRGETATSGETNKATKPLEVPPPLTDEQIAAMDKGTATKEWAARRAAFQRVSTSPDDKARLEAEVKKLEPKWKGTGS
jgi:Tfp pilus assembly protein PilN